MCFSHLKCMQMNWGFVNILFPRSWVGPVNPYSEPQVILILSGKGLVVAWYSWPFIFWLKSLFQLSSLTILHHICSPVTAFFLLTTVIVLARFKVICLNIHILDFTSSNKDCLGLTYCDITINVQVSVLYMHANPYYPHNWKSETLPTASSECSQNEPSKFLSVDPGVRRNSQPVPLIGNERKEIVHKCEVI